MTINLPENARASGKVILRVIRRVGDTSGDADTLPDGIPATGNCLFTPLIEHGAVLSPDYNALLINENITAPLYDPLTHAGVTGVEPGELMDESNRPGLWLAVGQWKITITASNTERTLAEKDFVVTSEHTELAPLDLATIFDANYVDPDGVIHAVLLPPGGPAGYVLTKNSSDDGDVSWLSPSGGGGTGSWNDLTDKPAFIGAGATAEAARTAIGAAAVGEVGTNGDSAYEVAVANGFVGTEAEWLTSLEGTDGSNGLSAYEVAVANGFVGTEVDWLITLVGDPGLQGDPGPAGLIVLDYGAPLPDPLVDGVLYARFTNPSGNFAPAILTHPQNTSAVVGDNVTLTASANGFPAPTGQWEINTGSGWSNISGQTTDSLVLPSVTITMTGYQYRITYTNSEGTVTSNVATLSVSEVAVDAPIITLHPTNQTITEGDPVTFTAAATDEDSAQWEINTGASWTAITGETTDSLTFAAATLSQSGHMFRCAYTNSGGTTYTNAATLTVNASSPTETLVFSDNFDRADGAIAAPWSLNAGTAAVIDNNALRVNDAGYHRVAVSPYGPNIRVEATILGAVLRFTGIFFGRSTTDPVTYPGIKVATTQSTLGFTATSAETVFGTTLDVLSDLTSAVAPDEAIGGRLGVEWNGSDLTLYWNNAVVEVASGVPMAGLIAPDAGICGIVGSSTTSVRWDDFEVWSL